MVKQKLLEKELEWYKKYKNIELKPINFNKNLIDDLFEEFNDYGMVEDSYCCMGEMQCCWQEVVEEGNWDLTLENVKDNII
jgi:hypothetical protein